MTQTEWFTDRLAFYHRDMTDVLPVWAENSIDACITDPPYGLAELPRKRVEQAMAAWLAGDRTHVPDGKGFMGRDWDKFVPPPGAWDEVYRVLKPGGYLLAFAATRTMDLMGLSIRLAGFEVLDGVGIPGLLAWCYGSGFPKSLDIGKAIDRTSGRIGHSVADLKARLQAAFEASGLTKKALNEACGFEASGYLRTTGEGNPWVHVLPSAEKWAVMRDVLGCGHDLDALFEEAQREVTGHWDMPGRGKRSAEQEYGLVRDSGDITAPATPEAVRWDGFGTALKPAWEPVIVARKPLDGTYAANVLKHGAGAMNIAACRVGTGDTLSRRNGSRDNDTAYNSGTWQEGMFGSGDLSGGRWPPNVLLAHVSTDWYALRHDIPREIRETIFAYYGDIETVREVRDGFPGDALGDRQAPVLLAGLRECRTQGRAGDAMDGDTVPAVRYGFPGVSGLGTERAAQILLESVSAEGAGRIQSGQDGQAAHRRVAGQDGCQPGIAGTAFPVERRQLHQQGLPVRDGGFAATGHAGTSVADDPERVHPGAQGGSGLHDRQAGHAGRGSAPYQRGEAGQPAGEFGSYEPGGSLAGAPGDRTAVRHANGRGGNPASGECTLAVPAGLIPGGWLRYFEYLTQTGCREAGTRKVRGITGGTGNHDGSVYGARSNQGQPVRDYAAADGTETVAAWDCASGCMVAALDAQSGTLKSGGGDRGTTSRDGLMGPDSDRGRKTRYERDPDSGGASRFFPQFGPDDVPFRYQAKAPRSERPRTADGKSWPTVKPQGLMRWLVRLVVPPGGTCLDPFAGTSATGQALLAEGMRAVLCERDPVAAELSLIRLALATPAEAMALVRGLQVPQEAPAS